jgi:transcriptional regulator
MSPGRFEALLKAIVGFELRIEALRGTRKLDQNRSIEERERVADALAGGGREELARLSRP